MKQYEVWGTVPQKVSITINSLIELVEGERGSLLGGRGRYIENGKVCSEYKYHTWQTQEHRDATEEEIKVEEAFNIVLGYLRGKRDA